MNLQTLTEHAANSAIRELELLSLKVVFTWQGSALITASSPCWMMRPSRCTCVRSPTCVTCCRPCRHFLACWCSNACTTKCAAGIQGLSKRCVFRFQSPRHYELHSAELHWMNVRFQWFSQPSHTQPSTPKQWSAYYQDATAWQPPYWPQRHPPDGKACHHRPWQPSG